MVDAKEWMQRGIEEEFAEAELGDVRRTQRLRVVAEQLEEAPGEGFPQMVETDGELEGIYRFLGNAQVKPESILAPHVEATMQRARQAGFCLVVHDTTAFEFGGDSERRGLGLTTGKKQGFYAHFALAVLPGEERVALGICGLERISRQIRKNTVRKRHSDQTAKDPRRESLRWLRMLQDVEAQRASFECIHVMDREADIFDLMAAALEQGARFVIRGGTERALADGRGLVEDELRQIRPVTYREAELSYRVDPRRKQIKPRRLQLRKARTAQLAIGGRVVELRRPKPAHADQRSLRVNIVHVWEPAPPKGQDPVDWVLFTTEPVDTPEQLHAVVDHYRSRWIIEEFFKALKTGCAFERRQLESFHALSNALAVFSVVAWRMLLARAVARAHPTARASSVLSRRQLLLLQHKLKLSKPPATAKDALYAVARLGGHLKHNGDPGWLSLGRGFEKLLLLEAGWQAAMAQFSLENQIND